MKWNDVIITITTRDGKEVISIPVFTTIFVISLWAWLAVLGRMALN